jgi:hypothetical protein
MGTLMKWKPTRSSASAELTMSYGADPRMMMRRTDLEATQVEEISLVGRHVGWVTAEGRGFVIQSALQQAKVTEV